MRAAPWGSKASPPTNGSWRAKAMSANEKIGPAGPDWLRELKFDAAGLVTAVAIDQADGSVLMLAHMNAEALRRTLDTGRMTYWSRSRQALWVKGETSGNTQKLV